MKRSTFLASLFCIPASVKALVKKSPFKEKTFEDIYDDSVKERIREIHKDFLSKKSSEVFSCRSSEYLNQDYKQSSILTKEQIDNIRNSYRMPVCKIDDRITKIYIPKK